MKVILSNEYKTDSDRTVNCPDCGVFLELESLGPVDTRGYCPACNRYYSREEILDRCAL